LVLVITLILCELGFRAYSSFVPIYDMEMHKYTLKLKRPSQVPGLSHEHVPNSQAKLMGVDISINGLGLRSPHEPAKLASDTHRVLMLGNSVTFGWGVDEKNMFTTVAERKLNENGQSPRTAILNAGIGNVNTRQELLLMKKLLDEVRPQVVILHYFVDDAEVMEPGKQSWILKNSLLAAMTYIRYRQALFSIKPKTGSLGDYYLGLYKPDAPGWSDVQKAIDDIRYTCAERGIKFGILLQPDLHDLHPESPQAKALKAAELFFRGQKIPCHHTSEALMAASKGVAQNLWVAPDDAHPNALGHRTMGVELAAFLKTLK
jgi:lysophospholipase L1-like esterase